MIENAGAAEYVADRFELCWTEDGREVLGRVATDSWSYDDSSIISQDQRFTSDDTARFPGCHWRSQDLSNARDTQVSRMSGL